MMDWITGSGNPIVLNTTKCENLGFKHLERINDPDGGDGTVIGVAPQMASFGGGGEDMLWCHFDRSKTENLVLNVPNPSKRLTRI